MTAAISTNACAAALRSRLAEQPECAHVFFRGSEPVGVEFAHPGQAQLSQQGQLWRDRK